MTCEPVKSEWSELLRKAYQRAGGPTMLAQKLGVRLETVRTWLRRMRSGSQSAPRDWLDQIKKLKLYLDGHYVSGPNPCGRARLWQTMRCLKKFFDYEVAAIAQTRLNSTQQYIRALLYAGYLHKIGDESGKTRYYLAFDSGPKPPALKSNRTVVYDNNLKRTFLRESIV